MYFPQDLTLLRQWVCWRLEDDPKGGKPNKIPYNPKTGGKASSTNPTTWTSLDEALRAKEKYLYTGVGFVFARESGIVGVDIDHCRDFATGALNETATAILAHAPTYTEISPSGTGLHLLLKGVMPEGGNKNSKTGVEMYGHSRYFTMTGKRLENTPAEVSADDGALTWIHENYVKTSKKERSRKKQKSKSGAIRTDDEVLEKALGAESGSDFEMLWEGRWAKKYASQSEADLALCCKLAFWTNKNPEQIDRLFRQSKLMRDKWDKVHHADGQTYGGKTVAMAVEQTEKTYKTCGGEPIFEYNGRYFRVKTQSIYPITNFLINPVEMIVSEDEATMTADLVTLCGETFRQTFMTTDFNNLQKFKNVLNKRTIALIYTGTEGDLELLKGYISQLAWTCKQGVNAIGLYEQEKRWVFVGGKDAVAKDGPVGDIVQLEKYRSLTSEILSHDAITTEQISGMGNLLLSYNEPAKTVPILAWCAGCFVKEHLKRAKVKYPHLFLIGEQGSGKSNTLERVILPIFSREKVHAATQVTAFTLMKDSASSNILPQALDEFKPSKIDRLKLNVLYNHLRDAYDGHEGVRGRVDQSIASYALTAPLAVAGEESPDEAAIRERGIELLFAKKDLKSTESRIAFSKLCQAQSVLGRLGRSLLNEAMGTSVDEVKSWYTEARESFTEDLPDRVLSNLTCCMVGLRLVEKLCKAHGFLWEHVFDITLARCRNYLVYAAREYLLDGGLSNKGIVEQSLEIMARMGLNADEYKLLEKGSHLALRLPAIYDRFTKYRRDHAIIGECLTLPQFQKQLKNMDFFLDYKTVRFDVMTAKAYILDITKLLERCDITGLINTDVIPLS